MNFDYNTYLLKLTDLALYGHHRYHIVIQAQLQRNVICQAYCLYIKELITSEEFDSFIVIINNLASSHIGNTNEQRGSIHH